MAGELVVILACIMYSNMDISVWFLMKYYPPFKVFEIKININKHLIGSTEQLN